MKYGIEFEYFVADKDNIRVPAYLATNNLDGNPFLGEIKTRPLDSILDCIFELKKLIHVEQAALKAKGFKMDIIPVHQFTKQQLTDFRKNPLAVNKKEVEVLEEFSIYPNGKLGKLLRTGEVKASLQINFSQHKSFSYPVFDRITVEDKYKYESKQKIQEYACLFNYVDIIRKLDSAYFDDIKRADRVIGVYAIKPGEFGDRIEYRSLPNTINFDNLIEIL